MSYLSQRGVAFKNPKEIDRQKSPENLYKFAKRKGPLQVKNKNITSVNISPAILICATVGGTAALAHKTSRSMKQQTNGSRVLSAFGPQQQSSCAVCLRARRARVGYTADVFCCTRSSSLASPASPGHRPAQTFGSQNIPDIRGLATGS